MLPTTAPQKFSEREILWNEVEYSEKRGNSRLAREIEVALPIDLTMGDNIRLVEEYVVVNFVDKGMCADVSIHDKGNGNPHAHILLTTREVTPDGFSPKKQRDWDKRERVEQWRREWADAQNREFERNGLAVRVSHRSNIARGIDREPTLHLGFRVKEYERRGIDTDRSRKNRAIIKRNRDQKEQRRQREQKHQRHLNRGRSR